VNDEREIYGVRGYLEKVAANTLVADSCFFVGIFSLILFLWVNHLSERQHDDSLMVDLRKSMKGGRIDFLNYKWSPL
jgi:hypothetical protein